MFFRKPFLRSFITLMGLLVLIALPVVHLDAQVKSHTPDPPSNPAPKPKTSTVKPASPTPPPPKPVEKEADAYILVTTTEDVIILVNGEKTFTIRSVDMVTKVPIDLGLNLLIIKPSNGSGEGFRDAVTADRRGNYGFDVQARQSEVRRTEEAKQAEIRAQEEKKKKEDEERIKEENRKKEEEARLAEEKRKKEEEERIKGEKKKKEEEARQAEEKRKKEEEERLNKEALDAIEANMILVEGGTFIMGDQAGGGEKDEKKHAVTVSGFYISRFEVTVRQFKTFIDDSNYQTDAEKDGGSYFWTGSEWEKRDGVNWRHDTKGNVRPSSDYNHPVIHVSWNDAVAYCKWLSQKTGKTYRLPTEAEWEYAGKSGNKKSGYKYAGSNNLDDVAWYSDNSGSSTHVMGTKSANDLGLFDMSGNVFEWCGDWYGDYPSGSQTNPTGPSTGSGRVIRGGSWNDDAAYCRASYRRGSTLVGRYGFIGFRILRTK